MIKYVTVRELYPVLGLSDQHHEGHEAVEISEEDYKEFLRVQERWDYWQRKIHDLDPPKADAPS